jgi:hypothetical protein
MKQRCDNPNNPKYPRYGGTGIGYDPAWASFEAFIGDMGERPPGTSLDRINNGQGYHKDNCRWADPMQQVMNRRCSRKIRYGGRDWQMRELADHFGITRQCLKKRLEAGWAEEHLGLPTQKSRHWRATTA